jgi:Mn2+/Fe2+ NRAMP family transporter
LVDEVHRSAGKARSSAVLDDAHLGDIKGAFGTIHEQEHGTRRTWRRRLLALAVIMGPGLIVMVGDNDAGGVATYAQAGQNYGDSLLWVLVLLIPVLIVNQEMVVRLGAVTGVGHGRLIFERFGKFWGWFSVGDLFLLNFLTITTEFIGIGLGAAYFGVSPYLAVPVGALFLIGITVTGKFSTWERLMFVILGGNALVIPLVVLAHPTLGPVLHGFLIPGIQGGLSSNGALLIVAIVGTTVAPWQLFFQQSNVVDKRITPRWIAYERTDTVVGAFVVVIGAAAIMITTAVAFHGTSLAGHFGDAQTVAEGLARHVSSALGAIFAVLLIDASIIGASAVTLATSYAFGDVFGIRHSLHRSWREAKPFYAVFTVVVVVAASIVLIPHAPLGLITTAVQALAGTLLPSASLFLLLLHHPCHPGGALPDPRLLHHLLGRQRHPAADHLRQHPCGRADRDRLLHARQPGAHRERAGQGGPLHLADAAHRPPHPAGAVTRPQDRDDGDGCVHPGGRAPAVRQGHRAGPRPLMSPGRLLPFAPRRLM